MAANDDSPVRVELVHRLMRARDWQDRPQLAAVCDWWRAGGRGVCSLVGIGGAGKTAIADRFLQLLPQVTAQSPGVEKDRSLPVPEGLMVFSFYDVPNPQVFFDDLYDWLVRDYAVADRRPQTESGQQLQASAALVIESLRRLRDRVLLVLDGMEKVQDDGSRSGTFGHIEDGGLRALLYRAAAGWLPAVSVMVTTRFVPDDLEYAYHSGQAPLYGRIDVEQISEQACIDLLRTRGVRGGDDALAHLARHCGLHALTVDLAAGYLVQFCDGDPNAPLEMPTAEELSASPDTRNHRLRYVAEQSARFGKLARRYREALSRSDPAALALLERICLFRLGVTADVLAGIFTGEDKDAVSGPELAALTRDQLDAKLTLLTDMRLVESTTQTADHPSFSIHPAIRDGFLAGLDDSTARQAHEAAREGLEAVLADRPGAEYPSDPGTLDLLEEIVYHALRAGHAQEAYDIHRNRIGGYENLGWRLGDYERGERICRAFAGGQPPKSAPLPDGLSESDQAVFINEWALYLKDLGRLGAAARCIERQNEMQMRQEDWKNASRGSQNLAVVWLLAGRLTAGTAAAEEALRLAERADHVEERHDSYAYRAHGRALRGETDAALGDFRDAADWQHEASGKPDRPLWSLRGIQHTLLLTGLGRSEEATRLTEKNKQILLELRGPQHQDIPKCILILADLARRRGDLAAAGELLDQAHGWALARDAKEPLCWAELVRARIELKKGTGSSHGGPKTQEETSPRGACPLFQRPQREAAHRAIDDGLRIARECGYGIHHIDLLLERTRLGLFTGDAAAAEADVRTALFDGHKPPAESGLPELLAATHAECGYAWGEAEGRQLLAEALLLKAAQTLGQATYKPRSRKTPAEVRELIKAARAELNKCARLRKRIQDPEIARIQQTLKQLTGGVLTEYPLPPPEEKKPPPEPTDNRVFISYSHKDKAWLKRLLDMMRPMVRNRTVSVWWDGQIKPSEKWRDEIDLALASAKVAVLLVSADFLASEFITDEELPYLIDGARRRGVKLIWMLLGECLYEETPIAQYQAVHDVARPLGTLDKAQQDKVLADACRRIREA